MKTQSLFKPFALVLLISIFFGSCQKVEKTTIMLTTVDWPDFNPVSEVTVKIYETQTDYANKEGEIATKVSDAEGNVDFTDLEPETYYWIYAIKGNMNSNPNNDLELGNVRYESGRGVRHNIFID